MRRSTDFQQVQRTGRRVGEADLVVVFRPGGSEGSRVGLTVSRKVGVAVVRNRVKRWLREAVRHERDLIVGTWDLVLIARPSAALAGAARLRAQVAHAFTRLGRGARA